LQLPSRLIETIDGVLERETDVGLLVADRGERALSAADGRFQRLQRFTDLAEQPLSRVLIDVGHSAPPRTVATVPVR